MYSIKRKDLSEKEKGRLKGCLELLPLGLGRVLGGDKIWEKMERIDALQSSDGAKVFALA